MKDFTDNRLYHRACFTMLFYIVALPITFAQQPVADFTSDITSGCFPITVNYQDLSTNSPTSWLWDFDNGNTSVLQNPSAVYLDTGTYTVTLIACNGNGCDTIIKNDYITLYDYPVADFTSDVTYGCAPLTVQYTDLSTPTSSPIVSWFWDFGDANSSTASNPVHTYQDPGVYDVSISITDSLGCNQSKASPNYIIVSTPPALSFTMDSSSSCTAPLTVNFTNTSTAGTYPIISWYWDFGDTFSDTIANPQHIYSSTGNYSVSLTATDSIGCAVTLTDTNAVNIGRDTADFTIFTVRTCSELQASFSGSSTGNIADWSWDLGDGSPPQNGQNITHNYTSSGQFNVTLITTNTSGCPDTVIKSLSYLKVEAFFYPDTTYGCSLPFTVSYTDTSIGTTPFSWRWDFSYEPPTFFQQSTLQNPSYTYTYQDTFDVMLIVTDSFGCADTATLKGQGDSIWVLELRADFLQSPYDGCIPLAVSYTDISISDMGTITDWAWDFDDLVSGTNNLSSSQNPSHTFDSTGIYDVTLEVTNDLGCTDIVIRTTRSGYPPLADSITKSLSIACHGEPVLLTAFSSDTNVNGGEWDFGDGTGGGYGWPLVSHEFQDTGSLTITFTPVFNGCEGTPIFSTIYILPPKPIFTASSYFSCRPPFAVTFTNSSWGADSQVWDFGDGSPTDPAVNPIHTYTDPGRHTVWLNVSNLNGCTDSISRVINIPQPTASFTASPLVGCVPLNVTFTNTSFTYLPSSYKITSWSWDFGDGTFSTLKNPTHTYFDTATFTVTLIITDESGCKDTLVRTNYISTSGSTADFIASPTLGCAPLTVNFTDQSVSSSPIVSRSWDFGDGSPLNTTENPTHVYSSPGNFDVMLTTTDSVGCVNTMTKLSFIAVPKPNAAFTNPPKICLNQPFIFTNTTPDSAVTYAWDFGDANTSTFKFPVHSYSDTGIFTVTLIVTDTNGCSDTATGQIEGIAIPVPNFAVDSIFALCPPLLVQFTDLSTNVNDVIVSWYWDFGDSTSATPPNPVHTFTYPDIFSIQLTVTNSTGCVDSLLIPDMITVAGPTGNFSFSPDTGCVPFTVSFSSSTSNTEVFTWDFGDGVVDTTSGPSVLHTYIQPGYPTPQLYMTDSMGCKLPASSLDSVNLTIGEVVAAFSMSPSPLYTPLCPADTVFFIDSSYSLNDSAAITGWLWDFGDSSTDTVQNPIHIYTDTGSFDITLTAYSSLGCSDVAIKTINVILIDSLVLKSAIVDSVAITCYGLDNGEATATGLSGTPPYSYLWGSSAGNQSTVTATGLSPGIHSVVVTDSMGCKDSVTVMIDEPAELIVLTDSIAGVSCFGFSDGNIAASATGGLIPYSYQWDTAAGNQTTPQAINLIAGGYTITVTDSNGCTATLTDTVPEPDTLILSILDTIPVACFGDSSGSAMVSTSGGTAPYSYTWNPLFAGSNDTALNLPAQNYSVTVTDNNGCDTSLNLTITEPSVLSIVTTKTDVSCDAGSDGSATANLSGGVPPYNYSWNTSPSQSTQTADSIPVGTWTVTVTDSNGCTITATTDTLIAPPPLIPVLSKTDVSCKGGNDGTATVSCSGGVQPYTYVWNDPLAQTTTTAVGLTAETWTVTVTDSNNCTMADSITISEPDTLVILMDTNNITCYGGSDGSATANVSGGISPYFYLWNNPSAQTTSTSTNLDLGTWTVTVTDTNGCTLTDSVTISEPTVIVIVFDTSDVLCYGGNDGKATANPSGGTPPYSYLWNDSLDQTTQTVTGLSAGTWTVTVTDSNNCPMDTVVIISEPLLLTATINAIKSQICYGASDGELSVQASGGTAPYSYLWLPSDSTSQSIDSLPAGVYTITVTDSNNCEAYDTLAINQFTALEVTADDDGVDTACYLVGDTLEAQTTGSVPPYTFSWTDGTVNISGNPITVFPDTSQIWSVIVTDSAGCTDTDSVTLYVNYLELSLTYEDTVCFGTLTTLEAEASGTLPGTNSTYSYLWNTGQTTSSIQIALAGIATLMVTVTDGCSRPTTASATIYLYPFPDIGIKIDLSPVCAFTEITFSDTINNIPGSQYLWDFDDGYTGTGLTVQHFYSSGGTYYPSVTVTTPQGCSLSAALTVPVEIHAIPYVNFMANPKVTEIIYPLVSFTNISWVSSGGIIVSQLWEFGDGDTSNLLDPTHIYQDTGSFPVTLTVTTQFGCVGQITKIVRIDPHIEFSIPNAFTPNPYGSSGGTYDPESFDNDVFYPLTKYVREYLFQIYNRWGELVFKSDDLAIGWDGYYKGKLCQQETYIWKLDIEWTTGRKFNEVGRILLIR